jgi:hypothetical protein
MMQPKDMARAREQLGLTLFEMATMLGYLGTQRDQMMHDLETGRRAIREPQRRLTELYLSGARPDDWPRLSK